MGRLRVCRLGSGILCFCANKSAMISHSLIERPLELTSNEKNLVERFRNGDDVAFDELYRLMHERIYRFALRLTGNAHDAEDVTVQTFSEAFRGRMSFQGTSRIETWLYRIAVHLAARLRRSRRSEPLPETETEDRHGQRHVGELELSDLIVKLPLPMRTAFVLVKVEGLTHKEAAEVLGRKLGTVQSQVFEACKILRGQLIGEAFPVIREHPERCVL